ncbi:hypothetical protein C2E23DRAFT_724550 [Lenzites betulinus]|nr:hypothetical protein C2E23DRAFT_724550 [Lenzites betulinus]
MATAVQLPSPDAGAPLNDVSLALVSPNSHSRPKSKSSNYSQRLTLTEFDLSDDRYPSLASTKGPVSPTLHSPTGGFDPALDAGMTAALRASYEKSRNSDPVPSSKAWIGENITQEPAEEWQDVPAQAGGPAMPREPQLSPKPEGTPYPSASVLSPADSYGFDRPSAGLRPPRDSSGEQQRLAYTQPLPPSPDMGQSLSSPRAMGDQYELSAPGPAPRHAAMVPQLQGPPMRTPSASPRHSTLPTAGIGAGPSSSSMSPIVPMSAGPTYNAVTMQSIPISPKPRAYPQHPTYITPAASPAMQPSFSPPQVPKEEVCVECAMRDQDMADVDVTGPGVWERESDIMYEELCRREAEEETSGRASSSENHSRPRAKGGPLTEDNLRFWLSINPKEPSSRQQTLDQYVKSQRHLLEAEALARARALRESRLLDEKMRDTFSQLRRSAYELGSSSQPTDDSGALRIKSAGNAHAHAREVTLLENGMIVEHVDLRKEEKEERERRRKSEKREKRELSRARKSSRSSRSAADVASVYSMPLQSPLPQMDSGFFSGARDSRHSQSFSPRPSSVLTGGADRPQTLLRAQSQASFSDMQSVGSASSPRRSRFFGFKNLSAAWLSRDSVAPSGSMMDMHVALQQEQQYFAAHPSAVELASNTPTLKASQSWPRGQTSPEPTVSSAPTKKKNGLKKIWKLVTGSSKGASKGVSQSKSVDRHDDDAPLAPPPPLSYLVDREGAGRRHVSTPSLLSSMSPNGFSQFAPSPPTAPSSALPSPTSSRYPVMEEKSSGEAHKDQANKEMEPDHRISAFELAGSNDVNSPDSELRGRTTHSSSKTLSSVGGPATPGTSPPHLRPQSTMLTRDKSLPPLPGESTIEFPNPTGMEPRPQTMYDLLQNSSSPQSAGLLPPQAPFRTTELRRQSFGGLGSSPHPAVQSLPARSPYARGTVNVPPFLAEEKYAEFGASSPSLTQWGAQAGKRALTTPSKPKQRRSRFGLSSLFGKKSGEVEREAAVFTPSITAGENGEPADYNPYRSSASDQRDEPSVSFNGYSGPGSTHSSMAPRMSIASKKNIAELVDQDPEFVAYRYPSAEHRLEVLR